MELQVKSTLCTYAQCDFSLSTVRAMDYQPLHVTLRFQACDTLGCVVVEIIDDTVKEADEVFTYTLRRTPDLDPRIELNPVDGQVEIGDDDSEYQKKHTFNVNNNFFPKLNKLAIWSELTITRCLLLLFLSS